MILQDAGNVYILKQDHPIIAKEINPHVAALSSFEFLHMQKKWESTCNTCILVLQTVQVVHTPGPKNNWYKQNGQSTRTSTIIILA